MDTKSRFAFAVILLAAAAAPMFAGAEDLRPEAVLGRPTSQQVGPPGAYAATLHHSIPAPLRDFQLEGRGL